MFWCLGKKIAVKYSRKNIAKHVKNILNTELFWIIIKMYRSLSENIERCIKVFEEWMKILKKVYFFEDWMKKLKEKDV